MYPAYVNYLMYDANDPAFLELDRQVASLPDTNVILIRGVPFVKLWREHGLMPGFLFFQEKLRVLSEESAPSGRAES